MNRKPKWSKLAKAIGMKVTDHPGKAVKQKLPKGVKISFESQGVGKPLLMKVEKQIPKSTAEHFEDLRRAWLAFCWLLWVHHPFCKFVRWIILRLGLQLKERYRIK